MKVSVDSVRIVITGLGREVPQPVVIRVDRYGYVELDVPRHWFYGETVEAWKEALQEAGVIRIAPEDPDGVGEVITLESPELRARYGLLFAALHRADRERD